MGNYIGEIVKLRREFFKACDEKTYPEALKTGLAIIKLYNENNAQKGLEYANDIKNTAIVYDYLMLHEKAVKLYEEAAEIIKEKEGEESLNYADTISNLAVALSLDGKHKEAYPYHRKALKIRENHLETNHCDCITSLYNLGSACEDLKKYDRAFSYYDASCKRVENQPALSDKDREDIFLGCARMLVKKGKYKKAIESYEKACDLLKKEENGKGFYYLANLLEMAVVCQRARLYKKTHEVYERALNLRKGLLDKTHLDYVTNINAAANAFLRDGQYEKALEKHEESKKIIESLMGHDHPFYSDCFCYMAYDYAKMGNYEEAVKNIQKALETEVSISGRESPEYSVCLETAGKVYMQFEKYDAAEQYFLKALEIRRKLAGDKKMLYIDNLMDLARLYTKEKKYGMAAQYYYDAANIKKDLNIEEDITEAVIFKELSEMLVEAGKINDAVAVAEKSLDIRKEVYGRTHPKYARGMYYLSKIYLKADRVEDALNLLAGAIDIQKECLGEESKDYKDTLEEIIKDELYAAKYYEEKLDYDAAYDHFDIADIYIKQEENYDDTELNIKFANLIAHRGKIEEALEMLQKAEKVILEKYGEESEKYCEFLFEKGRTLITAGAVKNAEGCLFKCIETGYMLGKDDYRDKISIMLGNAYLCEEDYKKAKSYFVNVKPESECFEQAQAGIKDCEFGLKDEKMSTLIDEKKRLEMSGNTESKEYADILWELGKLYEDNKNSQEAEKLYKLSIEKRNGIEDAKDNNLKGLLKLAVLMKKNGHLKEAAELMEIVSESILESDGKNGEYIKALLKSAKLYADSDEKVKAEKLFKKAALVSAELFGEKSDAHIAIYFDMTAFYIKLKEKIKAVRSFNYILKKATENESSIFNEEKYRLKLEKMAEKIQKI